LRNDNDDGIINAACCHDENGGNIENYEIEIGDRQDGGALTSVPRKSCKILRVPRIKVLRKNWDNEASHSNNSEN
jgi:hypothetical protein